MGNKQSSNKEGMSPTSKGGILNNTIDNKQTLMKKVTFKEEVISGENKVITKVVEKETIINETQVKSDTQVKPYDIKIVVPKEQDKFKDLVLPSNTRCSKLMEEIEKRMIVNTEFLITANGHFLKKYKNYELSKLNEGKDEFVINIRYLGLELPDSISTAYNRIQYIARPIYDPFNIVVYDKKKEDIFLLDPEESKVLNQLKSNLEDLHVYCNSLNTLYISTQTNNNFYCVDIINKTITVKERALLHPRKLFSMIYIPNTYIFIVGGKETTQVEYYDIKQNTFLEHSELEDIRLEPSLALINHSFLYAFSGFDVNKKRMYNFEKINLASADKDWIKCEFNIDPKVKFTQSLFAVSYLNKNEVIFLGGFKDDNKTFIFNFKEEKLYPSDVAYLKTDFSEKFLIPLNGKYGGIIFPNFSSDIHVIRFDDKKKKMETIRFDFVKESL
jgi:hypothetical protein